MRFILSNNIAVHCGFWGRISIVYVYQHSPLPTLTNTCLRPWLYGQLVYVATRNEFAVYGSAVVYVAVLKTKYIILSICMWLGVGRVTLGHVD